MKVITTSGARLLGAWMRRHDLDALAVAQRLRKAAAAHPLVRAPRRPYVRGVKEWLTGESIPSHAYRELLRLVTDGYVTQEAWTEREP
jgi:hypothetical protein